MGAWAVKAVKWIAAFVDDALPVPPDDRAPRKDGGRRHRAARDLRLKLHLLQKRGRGGYR